MIDRDSERAPLDRKLGRRFFPLFLKSSCHTGKAEHAFEIRSNMAIFQLSFLHVRHRMAATSQI